MRRAPLAVVAALLAGLGVTAADAGAQTRLTACSNRSSDTTRCGHVAVPLDRTGALPGTLSLKVRVVPARRGAATATILVLAGGPGQAATPLAGDVPEVLGSMLDRRQAVLVDQRGTGGTALRCPSLQNTETSTAAEARDVAACAARIGPARTAYTTAASVADIESVRQALGLGKLIIWGTSYGTKVALNYAQTYPQNVQSLVLDSVVLPEGPDPFSRSTLAALPRVLRSICAGGGCPFTRDPAGDLTALVARLERGPLRGHVVDDRGRVHGASVTPDDVLQLLLSSDLDPFERASLPSAIRSGRTGDAAPLLALAREAEQQDSGGDEADGLYVATVCEDGPVPWAAGTPVPARAAATTQALGAIGPAAFAPFSVTDIRDLGFVDLCRGWPESPVAQSFGPLPAVPTLILSGDEDLRTPRSDALVLRARIPGAQLIAVPHTGHSVLGTASSDCPATAMAAFLAGRTPSRCGAAKPFVPVQPLAPPRLDAVSALRGYPTRVGRTLHAVELTFREVSNRAIVRLLSAFGGGQELRGLDIPGLRAGYAQLGNGTRLRGYSYVPGVTVTLTAPDGAASFAMTIGGSAGVRGTLRYADGRLTGALIGTPVNTAFRLRAG